MSRLKYKVIKSRRQYSQYCLLLEHLISKGERSAEVKEEIELLTVLIEKWDKDHNSLLEADPISLLRSLMKQRSVRPIDLADILNVSKGLVSDILNCKKGMSKNVIKRLAAYFKVSQEAFNRPVKIRP